MENMQPSGAGNTNPESPIPNPLNAYRLLDAVVRKRIAELVAKYPNRQAATLPTLHFVNDVLGYVPPEAVVEVAELLELSPAQVQDTLSFYGFFKQDKPHGKYRVWVCRSITCAACGGEELLEHLCERLGIRPGETTADGRVTLEFAECLGACDTAPAVLVNRTVHGNMTKEKLDELVATVLKNPASATTAAHPIPNP
jgi:NADH-quinone oxidoreductase subunit E